MSMPLGRRDKEDRESELQVPTAPSPPTGDTPGERAPQVFEANRSVPGQTLFNRLAAEAQLRRESQQTFWLARERQRRQKMFPRPNPGRTPGDGP